MVHADHAVGHVATAPTSAPTSTPATATKAGRPRKSKRVDANGQPMKRIVLVVSKDDYDRITASVALRTGPLFVRAFGGDKISIAGDPQEYQGRAIAWICDAWSMNLETIV